MQNTSKYPKINYCYLIGVLHSNNDAEFIIDIDGRKGSVFVNYNVPYFDIIKGLLLSMNYDNYLIAKAIIDNKNG